MKALLTLEYLFIFFIIETNSQEDIENPIYHYHFNLSDPDIVIIDKDDKDNKNPEIKDIITKDNSIRLPKYELDKEDYFFSGWTIDWVYGYEPGDIVMANSLNVTLEPVFGLLADKRTFTLEYVVEFGGEIFENTGLSKGHYCKNRIVKTSLLSIHQEKAVQRGWTDGKNEFAQEQKMVMPEHNVTLRALFFYYRNLTYVPGDVDGIIGALMDIQTMRAGGKKDLAESSRLTRKGYTIVAWHCENDGKDYPLFYPYIMPDENVIMTAVWEPLNYVVVFNVGISSVPSIKIPGKTKDIIIAPSPGVEREGFLFGGWMMYGNDVYFPGDEIEVKGQMPGMGIAAKAIWVSK